MIPDNDPVWSCNVVLFLVISILMGDSAAIVQVLGKQKKKKKNSYSFRLSKLRLCFVY